MNTATATTALRPAPGRPKRPELPSGGAAAGGLGSSFLPALQTGFTPTVGWAEMVAHRSYLVRFAQRKLRDPLMAEDVVHDVFEAVLSGRAVFAGRAALRS